MASPINRVKSLVALVSACVVVASITMSPAAARQATEVVEKEQGVRVVASTAPGERYSIAGYAAIECNAHSYGGDTWTTARCRLAKTPFEARVDGVALSLLTADGRIFVATCKSKRTWWGGARPCRVPSVQDVTVEIVGPNPFYNLKANLRWTNAETTAVERETYAVLATLHRVP